MQLAGNLQAVFGVRVVMVTLTGGGWGRSRARRATGAGAFGAVSSCSSGRPWRLTTAWCKPNQVARSRPSRCSTRRDLLGGKRRPAAECVRPAGRSCTCCAEVARIDRSSNGLGMPAFGQPRFSEDLCSDPSMVRASPAGNTDPTRRPTHSAAGARLPASRFSSCRATAGTRSAPPGLGYTTLWGQPHGLRWSNSTPHRQHRHQSARRARFFPNPPPVT